MSLKKKSIWDSNVFKAAKIVCTMILIANLVIYIFSFMINSMEARDIEISKWMKSNKECVVKSMESGSNKCHSFIKCEIKSGMEYPGFYTRSCDEDNEK